VSSIVPTSFASPSYSTHMSWTWQYIPGTMLTSQTDPNGTIFYTSTFSQKEIGTVSGICNGVESGTIYPDGLVTFSDECVFIGTVFGLSGTYFENALGSYNTNAWLGIYFEVFPGTFNSDACPVSGTFAINGISGYLGNMYGYGTWRGSVCGIPYPSGTYAIQNTERQ